MAVATAAKKVLIDYVAVTVGGGVESISLVQNEHPNKYRSRDPWPSATASAARQGTMGALSQQLVSRTRACAPAPQP